MIDSVCIICCLTIERKPKKKTGIMEILIEEKCTADITCRNLYNGGLSDEKIHAIIGENFGKRFCLVSLILMAYQLSTVI